MRQFPGARRESAITSYRASTRATDSCRPTNPFAPTTATLTAPRLHTHSDLLASASIWLRRSGDNVAVRTRAIGLSVSWGGSAGPASPTAERTKGLSRHPAAFGEP